jgi:hypothetical protein
VLTRKGLVGEPGNRSAQHGLTAGAATRRRLIEPALAERRRDRVSLREIDEAAASQHCSRPLLPRRQFPPNRPVVLLGKIVHHASTCATERRAERSRPHDR